MKLFKIVSSVSTEENDPEHCERFSAVKAGDFNAEIQREQSKLVRHFFRFCAVLPGRPDDEIVRVPNKVRVQG